MSTIIIDPDKIVGTNKLSLGINLSYGSLGTFYAHSELRQLAKEAKIKLIRIWDGLKATHMPTLMPCTYFDEATKTGTYDWTNVDDIVGKIFEIDAEPLILLGVIRSTGIVVPPGMATNSATGLPYPESYASYCAEWVKHFKAKGWSVRFYEILNEIWVYFGQSPVNTMKLGYYMALFGACRAAMKNENPNVIVSFDFIHKKPVLDYWLAHNGPDVDSLNYHKYDEWRLPPVFTEERIIRTAENVQDWYSIVEAEQVWYQQRGKHLPMINSETNMNGASPTTDERLQMMTGTVWHALLLRAEILGGVSYHCYFELSSSWYLGSWGFGMVNTDGFKPWYPYYLCKFIGTNLAVEDRIVEATSTENVRALAWNHDGKLNILLICKIDSPQTINLQGITGELEATWIDNSIPYTNPALQTATIDASNPITLNGYTVMLLQQVTPTPPEESFFDKLWRNFEDFSENMKLPVPPKPPTPPPLPLIES